MKRFPWLFVPMLACAIACNVQRTAVATQSQNVQLEVPAIKQPYMRCLVASVSMVLKYWGREVSPDAIGGQVPVYRDGTAGKDLAKFVESLGFHGFLIQPSFDDLLEHLTKRRPLIIALPAQGAVRHAMVFVGFDLTAGTVSLNDPASGKRITDNLVSFRKRWEEGKRWTFLIVPKPVASKNPG
jgi:ABC-type bacteriocin/lantibiotic exporter with double-glycine peptidase domain